MKITCTIELEVDDEVKAEEVAIFVDCVQVYCDQEWPFWRPRVSVNPVTGVEVSHGDTGRRRELDS
jgi:hypothetical protein